MCEFCGTGPDCAVCGRGQPPAVVLALEGARTMIEDMSNYYPERELHKPVKAMLAEIDAALAGAA